MADRKPATRSAVRIAENESSFRAANERLVDKRTELELEGRTPFLCECDDPDCTTLIHLSLDEYEHVRSQANWFLIAAHHSGDGHESVERHGDYVIAAKSGLAGRIAIEEDPRT